LLKFVASKKLLDTEKKVMRTKVFKQWSKESGAAVVGGSSGALIAYLFNQEDKPKLDFTISGGVKP